MSLRQRRVPQKEGFERWKKILKNHFHSQPNWNGIHIDADNIVRLLHGVFFLMAQKRWDISL